MIIGKDLEALLPQSHPMLMIDKLIHSSENSTKTSFVINENNIFVQKEKLREPGIIENIAQTAAVRSGYESSITENPVKIGFIGSIKNLSVYFLPNVGEIIQTDIEIKTVIGEITVIHAKSKVDKRLLAECEMTIILADYR